MKNSISIILATIIGLLEFLFGGNYPILEILLTVMVLDYISGIITGLMQKSNKTESGRLSSKAGFKGLCKKVLILIICAASFQLDKIMTAKSALFTVVTVFYICNEILSILENSILMGLPVPGKLRKAIDELLKGE